MKTFWIIWKMHCYQADKCCAKLESWLLETNGFHRTTEYIISPWCDAPPCNGLDHWWFKNFILFLQVRSLHLRVLTNNKHYSTECEMLCASIQNGTTYCPKTEEYWETNRAYLITGWGCFGLRPDLLSWHTLPGEWWGIKVHPSLSEGQNIIETASIWFLKFLDSSMDVQLWQKVSHVCSVRGRGLKHFAIPEPCPCPCSSS